MPTNSPTAKRKRGRPSFAPTAAAKRRVAIAASAGMRHEDIAIGLGISRDTLSKYFEHELSVGAQARRMEILEAMHAAAKKGSSSAARVLLAVEPRVAAPPLPKDPLPAAAAAPKLQPLGKKEQAQIDAVTAQAGTDWDSLLKPAAPLQ